jgi:hypothetical protein
VFSNHGSLDTRILSLPCLNIWSRGNITILLSCQEQII